MFPALVVVCPKDEEILINPRTINSLAYSKLCPNLIEEPPMKGPKCDVCLSKDKALATKVKVRPEEYLCASCMISTNDSTDRQ